MVFEVGDKVKIIDRLEGNLTGACDWNIKKGDVGRVGFIEAICDHRFIVTGPQYLGIFSPEELELVSRGGENMCKKYILIDTEEDYRNEIFDSQEELEEHLDNLACELDDFRVYVVDEDDAKRIEKASKYKLV